MPKLGDALKLCYEAKPENPIDFLAETLLRNEEKEDEKKLEDVFIDFSKIDSKFDIEDLFVSINK